MTAGHTETKGISDKKYQRLREKDRAGIGIRD
jgi:hypothetical protein